MRNCFIIALLVLPAVSLRAAGIVSAKDIAGDGTKPCAEAVQRLIDANPSVGAFNAQVNDPESVHASYLQQGR